MLLALIITVYEQEVNLTGARAPNDGILLKTLKTLFRLFGLYKNVLQAKL